MNKRKIFNDPVYGFISFEYDILYDLIEEPIFQRLRRIKQCGLSDYVYPGALHTRFHHALGATHLMQLAIQVLRQKGVMISHDEAEGACIAILLHDSGHAPFSHALEQIFTSRNHESISLDIFHYLNKKYHGALDLAIRIFTDQYPNRFLHQLVSGQLDMDRMDYLNRDSYFTGVAEGIIGYDRIIKMLDVRDDKLVVEEKGIYSIEKFLIARKIMYWQVYLHKTVIAAEQMLRLFMTEARRDPQLKELVQGVNPLLFPGQPDRDDFIPDFIAFDDYDIVGLLKRSLRLSANPLLTFLSTSLLERNLFKVITSFDPLNQDMLASLRERIVQHFGDEAFSKLLIVGSETNTSYREGVEEIYILKKTGEIEPFSRMAGFNHSQQELTKYFVCHPRM
ncbi:MAG: HD domain-containing protein [Saprospiraceae bacterium]|nr:HD domain-containing protein [Saprospiraceae bacterium]